MAGIRLIVLSAAFIVTCVLSASVEDIFPKGVKICKRSDSDFSSCLKNSIQESWSTLVQGVPALQMPVLEPVQTDVIEHTLEVGLFAGHVELRNVKIHGQSKTEFLDVKPEFSDDKIKIDVKIAIPHVLIECDYDANGSAGIGIFSAQIGGKGQFNVTMTNLTAMYSLVGQVKDDHWVVEHFVVDPEVEGMKVYFSDLFNGNKKLNDAALTIVNQYWRPFFKEMKPIIVALSDSQLTEFVNQHMFSQVPVSKLFPA